MDSDFQQQQYQHHFQDRQRQFHHQKQQMNSLTRFRSAPSTYFASFLDAVDNTVTNDGGGNGGGRRNFSGARPLSPETENIFDRFMSSMGAENNTSSSQKLSDIPENTPMQQQPQYMVGTVKQEIETLQQEQQHQQQQQQQQQQSNYSTSQKIIYQSQSKPPLARQNSSSASAVSAAMESFRAAATSMGMESLPPQMKISGGNNYNNNSSSSSLTRHSSSPAGFFANILNIDNGFDVMKGMGNYGGGQPTISSSGMMNQNSDGGAKRFSNSSNNNDSNYMTGYPMSSWDDSILAENFSSLDRTRSGVDDDDDEKTFSELNASENQSGDGRNRPTLLSHHLSLPKTSALEKLLQFQDSVPLRIRAKRGCATHPRSIAERVRRTRISERMRKLQDLVPNMDKQTNTADMLDLAVEYIKELQKQVKDLADNRAKCTCS